MANKAVILTSQASETVPEADFSKAMKDHNAFGTAFVADGSLNVLSQPSPFDVESFKKLEDELKSLNATYIFQTMTTPINVADVQPFTLDEDDGTTKLAVFIEGDYDRYAKPGEVASAERQWFETVLKPMLGTYAEGAGESASIDGFFKWLEKPENAALIKESTATRGVIRLLSDSGEFKTFTKGTGFKVHPWGEVSHVEGEFPEKVEAPAKKSAVLGLFKKAAAAKAEEAPTEPAKPEPEKKEDDKIIIHKTEEPKKTETASVPSVPGLPAGKVWARPIRSVRNHNKTMKKTLENMLGALPKGWPSMDWFAVDAAKVKDSKNWELKEQGPIAEALTKAKNGKEDKLTAQAARAGLVPPKQQEDFKNIFMKSPEIVKAMETPTLPTIEELQAIENKDPTWYDKTGIHVQDTLNWPATKIEDLDRNYHELFRLRQQAITNMLIKQLREHPPAEKTKETPEEVVSEKTGTSEEEKRKNLANLNKDLVPPKKTSIFGNLKKTA